MGKPTKETIIRERERLSRLANQLPGPQLLDAFEKHRGGEHPPVAWLLERPEGPTFEVVTPQVAKARLDAGGSSLGSILEDPPPTWGRTMFVAGIANGVGLVEGKMLDEVTRAFCDYLERHGSGDFAEFEAKWSSTKKKPKKRSKRAPLTPSDVVGRWQCVAVDYIGSAQDDPDEADAVVTETENLRDHLELKPDGSGKDNWLGRNRQGTWTLAKSALHYTPENWGATFVLDFDANELVLADLDEEHGRKMLRHFRRAATD